MTAAVLPICDTPQVVFEELLDVIALAIDSHPRSQQTRIGPSEIGEPCSRALLDKLMGVPEPDEPPNWKTTSGTAIHSWMQETFDASILNQAETSPRFLTERRVTVGRIGDVDITGSCDLYDTASRTVVDWKTAGKTALAQRRRNGPGQKYRTQLHLYGLGWSNAGYEVATVMDVFLPRDGNLSDFFYHAEPYDPQVALDALARANQLLALGRMLGTEQAQALYPPCDSEWCRTCRDPAALQARFGHGSPARKPGQPTRPAASTRELFATH